MASPAEPKANVKIGFYGAAGEVTGSNFLIDTGSHKYLVDCGLFQGEKELTEHNDEPFGYNPAEIDAVIITHAHLDHIGRVPRLVKEGFKGPIYATQATLELGALVLQDAMELAQRREERSGQAALFDEPDLRRTLRQFAGVPYHEHYTMFGKDTVTFYDAGHILGSSSVVVEAGGKKIVFSGDIGHAPNVLLPAPEDGFEADAVILEGTYGGRERDDKLDRLQVLKEAVEWVGKERGVLLIPAFSIERSQELIYLFNTLFNKHQLPKIPIFLDSPLAIEGLQVFEKHMELYKNEVQKVRQVDDDIFDFRGLVLAATVEDSKSINDAPLPKIIIAGSGMMEGGRIHHHLLRYLGWPNTYLMVVGYQAPGTLGQQILSGRSSVRILGQTIPVRAKIVVADVFSGHADNSELIDWVQSVRFRTGGRVFITHADADKGEIFKGNVELALGASIPVQVPYIGQVVDLDEPVID